MTQRQVEPNIVENPTQKTYYAILGVHPGASTIEIRHAFRELSKRFHPDTTTLPQAIATTKFQELNEAYGTLSNPERRSLYDLKIGYSRVNVIQAPSSYFRDSKTSTPIYTGPSDRPLSSGEIFALFLLGGTFIGCLLLAFVVALLRGDQVW